MIETHSIYYWRKWPKFWGGDESEDRAFERKIIWILMD